MKGSPIRYSADELLFVASRRELSRQQLHALFVAQFDRPDVTVDHIKALCTRNGWSRRARFSAAEDATIRAHFPHRPTAEVAAMIGRSYSATHQRAGKLKLRKTAAFMASDESGRIRKGERRGTATEFQKGLTPANKGVKHPKGWAPGRMRETQFKPGDPSWRYQPIGAQRVVGGYEYTKLTDTPKVAWTKNWRLTHMIRWEAIHGQLPAGHALKCLDGNRLNTDPANWTCVSRGLLPILNGGRSKKRIAFDAAPAELKPTVMAVAQLEHAMGRRRRRAKEQVA